MTESELYKELGILTKDKDKWKESIPYVSSFLAYDSVKIQAKALWLLGEMGLIYSLSVQDVIPVIVSRLTAPAGSFTPENAARANSPLQSAARREFSRRYCFSPCFVLYLAKLAANG